jgi:hypothetical protein
MDDVRRRIAAIGITQSIRSHSIAEYEFFHELVKRHAASEEKLKALSDIAIRQDVKNQKGLAIDIVNTDGSRTEISWKNCVTGKSESQRSKFQSALRYAVEDQIAAFRETNHVEICELCDTLMDPHGRGVWGREAREVSPPHVDHILHFEILVDNFMALHDITMPNEQTLLSMEKGVGTRSVPTEYEKEPVTYLTRFKEKDRDIAQRFAEYHREHATLRIICGPCNLKREKARKPRIQVEALRAPTPPSPAPSL